MAPPVIVPRILRPLPSPLHLDKDTIYTAMKKVMTPVADENAEEEPPESTEAPGEDGPIVEQEEEDVPF